MWRRKTYNLEDSHLLVIARVRNKIKANSDSQTLRYILNRAGESLDAKRKADK